jgi:hypothetical protein
MAATEDPETGVDEGGTSASSREAETAQHLNSERGGTRTKAAGRAEKAGALGRGGVRGRAPDEAHPPFINAAARTDDKQSHVTGLEVASFSVDYTDGLLPIASWLNLPAYIALFVLTTMT